MSQIIKNKDRAISDFMAEELLYDYVIGTLDKVRKDDIEKKLKSNKELSEKLNSIKQAINYCEILSKTKVSEPLIDSLRINEREAKGVDVNGIWLSFPDWLKISFQSLGLTAVVCVIAIALPWQNIFNSDDESGDQIILAKKMEAPRVENELEKAVVVKERPAEKTVDNFKKVVAAGVSKTNKKNPGVTKGIRKTEVTSALVKATKKENATKENPVKTGFVYRIKLTPLAVKIDSQEVMNILITSGASKAGKVKLGWKREDGSFYYHFQIDTAGFSIIKEKLAINFKINLVKYIHSRVMPADTVRAILTVD